MTIGCHQKHSMSLVTETRLHLVHGLKFDMECFFITAKTHELDRITLSYVWGG